MASSLVHRCSDTVSAACRLVRSIATRCRAAFDVRQESWQVSSLKSSGCPRALWRHNEAGRKSERNVTWRDVRVRRVRVTKTFVSNRARLVGEKLHLSEVLFNHVSSNTTSEITLIRVCLLKNLRVALITAITLPLRHTRSPNKCIFYLFVRTEIVAKMKNINSSNT